MFDEWVKFCTPFSNDVVVYAGALFDVEGMERLGSPKRRSTRYWGY